MLGLCRQFPSKLCFWKLSSFFFVLWFSFPLCEVIVLQFLPLSGLFPTVFGAMAFLEAVVTEGEFFFAHIDLSSAGGDDKLAFVCIDEQLLAYDFVVELGLVLLDFELREYAVPHREVCRVVLSNSFTISKMLSCFRSPKLNIRSGGVSLNPILK